MNYNKTEREFDISNKVKLMMFEIKRVRRFASGRSAHWSHKPAYDFALAELQLTELMERKAAIKLHKSLKIK